MYYELSSSGRNDRLIYNDDYDYDDYDLKPLKSDKNKFLGFEIRTGRKAVSADYVFHFKVNCSAEELRNFDFTHGIANCGNLIVSTCVADYFQQRYAQDVAFCRVVIQTATQEITEYKYMYFTSFADILFDQNESGAIHTPHLYYFYNPAFYAGEIPSGRILVQKTTFQRLMNEEDALKLKAQRFIGLGLGRVKMVKNAEEDWLKKCNINAVF